MYRRFGKRALDFLLAALGCVVLSPLLLVLTLAGAAAMRGNPFFVQERLGKDERPFRLTKFRTMDNRKDKQGNLLPDEERLNAYGRFLRMTSLDELPELFQILSGRMALVGPRPLLVSYLPYYTETERRRHLVRPGLTGLAQVRGRSFIPWEEIFRYDVEYVDRYSLGMDLRILLDTARQVLKHGDVADMKTVTEDEHGETWVTDHGEKKRLHRPLDVERSHEQRDRQ